MAARVAPTCSADVVSTSDPADGADRMWQFFRGVAHLQCKLLCQHVDLLIVETACGNFSWLQPNKPGLTDQAHPLSHPNTPPPPLPPPACPSTPAACPDAMIKPTHGQQQL